MTSPHTFENIDDLMMDRYHVVGGRYEFGIGTHLPWRVYSPLDETAVWGIPSASHRCIFHVCPEREISSAPTYRSILSDPFDEVPGLYVSPQGWDDSISRITTKEETPACTAELWEDVPLFHSPSALCPGEVNDNPIPPDEDARNGLSDNQAATETDAISYGDLKSIQWLLDMTSSHHRTDHRSADQIQPTFDTDGLDAAPRLTVGQTKPNIILCPSSVIRSSPSILSRCDEPVRKGFHSLVRPRKHTTKRLTLVWFILFNLLASRVLASRDLEAQRLFSDHNFCHFAKILALSVSALTSIGTGASAYFLSYVREASPEKSASFNPYTDFFLRGACSLSLVTLVLLYAAWFLCPRPERIRVFGLGAAVNTALAWLVMPSKDSANMGLAWLDRLITIVFWAVAGGIFAVFVKNQVDLHADKQTTGNDNGQNNGQEDDQDNNQHNGQNDDHDRHDPARDTASHGENSGSIPLQTIQNTAGSNSSVSSARGPPSAATTRQVNNPPGQRRRGWNKHRIWELAARTADVLQISGFVIGLPA